MNFKEIFEKIESSIVFKNLKDKNPELELCAGFFIMDFLSNDNKNTLDYRLGDKKKVLTFSINNKDEITINEDKLIEDPNRPSLRKISPEIKIEVDELSSIAKTQALDNGISSNFNKIVAVLQKYEYNNELKQIWNLTCMLESLIILNILIDSTTGEIIKFERKSMMDLVKKR